MNKKYILTEHSKEFHGITLYRIKALKDIPKYNVGEGGLGGFVKSEDSLSHEGNAWVGSNARVYGNACVSGNAFVSDNARVVEKNECINIIGRLHDITITPNNIVIGCKLFESLEEFNEIYIKVGLEHGYTKEECERTAQLVRTAWEGIKR